MRKQRFLGYLTGLWVLLAFLGSPSHSAALRAKWTRAAPTPSKVAKAQSRADQLDALMVDLDTNLGSYLLPDLLKIIGEYAREEFSIAAGGGQTLVAKNGMVWGLGSNNSGQLGDGTNESRYQMVPMRLPQEVRESSSIQIAAGGRQTTLLLDNKSLWVVGDNYDGQLGDGTYGGHNQLVPIRLPDTYQNQKIVQVAAGGRHTALLLENGSVWSAGNNQFGQLGELENGAFTFRGNFVPMRLPEELQDHKVIQLATGAWHSVLLSDHGRVWSVGNNADGQFGDGTNVHRNQLVPMRLPKRVRKHKIIQVATGEGHTALLLDKGKVWTVGKNDFGQLGDGTVEGRNQLVPMRRPKEIRKVKVTQIAAGQNHTVLLLENGSVWAVGDNKFGQLGDGTMSRRNQLVPMVLPDELRKHKIIQIAAGQNHTVLLLENGDMWAVGDNQFGQLGIRINWPNGHLAPILIPLAEPEQKSNGDSKLAGPLSDQR